jgi:hypothetical protein
MLSIEVRRRVTADVREEVGAVFFWPETGLGRVAYVVAAPFVLAVALVVLWVAGVLLLAGVGAVAGSDVLESVRSWSKGSQAGLYVGASGVTLLVVHAVVTVGRAVMDVRHERQLFGHRPS